MKSGRPCRSEEVLERDVGRFGHRHSQELRRHDKTASHSLQTGALEDVPFDVVLVHLLAFVRVQRLRVPQAGDAGEHVPKPAEPALGEVGVGDGGQRLLAALDVIVE